MIVGGGKDYTYEPNLLKFAAGETIVPFNVSITNDDMCEGIEMFTLTIQPYSIIINDINVGDPSEAVVAIVDDSE